MPEESKKVFKKSKDRVTALLLVNADGSERMLVVIGKSREPRCFRGIKNDTEFEDNDNGVFNNISFMIPSKSEALNEVFNLRLYLGSLSEDDSRKTKNILH
jgi:hypothetical protein